MVESLLRVRYAETDSMGVAYHANYLIWMEVGRTDYFRALGFTYKKLEDDYGIRAPVVEVSCRYRLPAFYDDLLVVKTRLSRANRRLLEFSYEILNADDRQLLAEGYSLHLAVDVQNRRTVFPESVLDILSE